MLRNVPVIWGERQIGYFQEACLDKTRKRVCALIVSSGMHGKRIVQTQHVHMIADGFVLVDNWTKYRCSARQRTTLFVRDTTGLLVGCVTDYAIDKTTMEILAVEIISGYMPKERKVKSWIYAYSFVEESDELSIPVLM